MPKSAEIIPIPATEGRAFRAPKGASFRVIDVDGGQVADVFAFVDGDPSEYHSAQHTRAVNDRLFPQVGEPFVSNRRRPLLRLERDDSPGVHDMLIAPCDPERFELLGAPMPHNSCASNLVKALGACGVAAPLVPQSINLFMAIPVDADGNLSWAPAPTEPGASVTFRALEDLVMVVSACPQDIVPINHCSPSDIAIEIGG